MTGSGFTALMGLALALLAVLGVELWPQPDAGSAPAPPPVQAPPAAPAQAPAGQRSVSVQDILDRPLFVPGRKVAEARSAPAAPPASLPRLAGVIVRGPDRSAVFVPAGGDKPVVAREGAQVAGYTVQAIRAGQVTVLGPDGTRELRPSFDPRPRIAGVPALPPGAANRAPGPALLDRQPLQGFPGLPGLPGLPAPPVPPQASYAR